MMSFGRCVEAELSDLCLQDGKWKMKGSYYSSSSIGLRVLGIRTAA